MTVPTMARVIVEIGFSGPTTGDYLHLDDVARGRLDTGTLAPAELWTDITRWVSSWQTQRSAARVDGPTPTPEGGTATLVLRNEDRRFDPAYLDGPYVSGGVTQVEPMRAIRIRAEWGGVTYPLWRGFVDDWDINDEAPRASSVTTQCVDAFAVFTSIERGAVGPVGAGEDSGARINRILDSAGWAASDRVIAAGNTALQETTLEGVVLDELLLVADSELGEFYMDASGRATFRARHDLLTEARSNTPQAVFGGPGGLPYANLTRDYDRLSIFNWFGITRVGGIEQVVEDLASQDAYLRRTWRRQDLLMTDDTTALDYARWLLGQSARPELRFAAMLVKPQRDPNALYPHALGREIGDRLTAIRRPPGGGDPIQRDVIVRGIGHVGTRETWETTWQFQSATRLAGLVLDSPRLGMLDNNALAF